MKKVKTPVHNPADQGNTTTDRAHDDVTQSKKINGISNAGGQRSDQTSNKDNQRKRGE